ncbi:MAG: Omp28-related outer membrane protein [Bacteroidia bacterium]|nr:Omp28-related outer membrane protein [Bacteroidia bacterium]
MKRFVLPLLSIVFITACEEVPPIIDFSLPYKTKDTTYIASTVPSAQHKAVLIEDITGVRCTNCPQAAAKISEVINEKSEDSVVAIALYTNHLPSFTTPWDGFPLCNSAIATTIVDYYGVPNGLPNGYVDRNIFAPSTVRFNAYTTWKNLVNQRLKLGTPVNINLQSTVNGRVATVKLNFQYNTDASSTNHKYALYLTESKIVGMQTGAPAPSDQYEHNHVLRYSFGNPLGIPFNAPLTAGRTFEKELDYTLPAEYVMENCHLVCVVTDVTTGEVVNVRSIHLK